MPEIDNIQTEISVYFILIGNQNMIVFSNIQDIFLLNVRAMKCFRGCVTIFILDVVGY